MRVVLASTVVPFVSGGATVLVDGLAHNLRMRGHEVEVLNFPFQAEPGALLEQITALRLLDLSQHGDRLIAVRTPSYLLQHPNKVVWFIHHYRAAYDLWNTEYSDLPPGPLGLGLRDAVRNADNAGLAECRRVFANSQVVARRLMAHNRVEAEVLYPPLWVPEGYRSGPMGDYILCINRLTRHKRQWLAVEALRRTRTSVRLVLAGSPDPGAEAYAAELARQISDCGLSERVQVRAQWISEEEKRDLLANCLAVAYFPVDEDSYGYPSLEAAQCAKPVLTTTDSGGTLELIMDRENGIVCPPDPDALAGAMDELYADRNLAARLGSNAQGRVRRLNVCWDHVVERLLA